MATIAQQLTELVNQKNALAANLSTKGVTASSSETLNTLVPKVLDIQTGGEIPDYMSAKNFTFEGNACIGYVGDNTLPEIIIPKSYSIVTNTETFVGAKVLDKEYLSMSIYDFQSTTFSDGGTNTQTYTSTSQLQNLSSDFPNDCYLVSMQGSYPFSFDFLQMASDTQMLQFPIAVNGQSFSDGMTAFDYIMQNDITDVNFGGDVEVTKVVDGNDYQVTSVSGSNNSSGFKNYQNRIILLSNLTSIGDYAFYDCNSLTSIEIPNSVTSIGTYAFRGCSNLTSVSLPSTLTSISNGAFYGCSGLTSITIPEGVTSIGSFAFYGCSGLTSIILPSTLTSIDTGVFQNCSSLEAFNGEGNSYYKIVDNGRALLVDGGKTLYAYAIGNTEPLYTIPEGVTSIGTYAFSDCSNLTSISIPEGVTSIGSFAFYGCSGLTSIILPSTLTSIGSDAFNACTSLTSITIPEGVTKIGGSTFYRCTSLTSITIPEGVTSIGNYAFSGCSSLTTMRVEATEPPTLKNTSAISTATTQIQVPMASVEAYKTATNWSNFADIIVGYEEETT